MFWSCEPVVTVLVIFWLCELMVIFVGSVMKVLILERLRECNAYICWWNGCYLKCKICVLAVSKMQDLRIVIDVGMHV